MHVFIEYEQYTVEQQITDVNTHAVRYYRMLFRKDGVRIKHLNGEKSSYVWSSIGEAIAYCTGRRYVWNLAPFYRYYYRPLTADDM